MMTERSRMEQAWQIYEINTPGFGFARFVMTTSLKRALELTIQADDPLSTGQMMIATNVTVSFLAGSDHQTATHTWNVLREAREDLIEYDHNSGWMRLELGAYN